MGPCVSKPSTKDNDVDNHFSKEKLGASNITLVTDVKKWEEKLSEADEAGKIVLVNFSADWCSPCRDVLPVFRSLAEKYTSIMFLIVDVDELAEFSTSWEIKATPTFFFLKNGREVDKLVGANKEELQRRTDVMAKPLTNSRSLVSGCRDQSSSQRRTEDNAKMQKVAANQTSSQRTDNDAEMQKVAANQTSSQRTDNDAEMQKVAANQTSSQRTDNDAKMQKVAANQTSSQRTGDNGKMQNVATNQTSTGDNAKMQNVATNQTSSQRTDNDAKMQKVATNQTSGQRRMDDNAKMQKVATN